MRILYKRVVYTQNRVYTNCNIFLRACLYTHRLYTRNIVCIHTVKLIWIQIPHGSLLREKGRCKSGGRATWHRKLCPTTLFLAAQVFVTTERVSLWYLALFPVVFPVMWGCEWRDYCLRCVLLGCDKLGSMPTFLWKAWYTRVYGTPSAFCLLKKSRTDCTLPFLWRCTCWCWFV